MTNPITLHSAVAAPAALLPVIAGANLKFTSEIDPNSDSAVIAYLE